MLKEQFAKIGEQLSKRPVIIAVIAAFAAMLLAAGFLNEKESKLLHMAEEINTVVAARDISMGEMVDEINTTVVKVPRIFAQPASFAILSDASGRVAVTPIPANTHITAANSRRPSEINSLSAMIPSGHRAVGISVEDSSGITSFIKPNDSVDIIGTFDSGDSQRTTLTILTNVQVLAVGSQVADALPDSSLKAKGGLFGGMPVGATGRSPLQKRTSIAVAATPADAQILSFANESGILSIAIRPYGENSSSDKPLATTITTIAGDNSMLIPSKKMFREYRGR